MKSLAGLFFSLLMLQSCGYKATEPEAFPLDGVNNSIKFGDLTIAGQPTQEALGKLSELGYKSVISVRGLDEVNWDEANTVQTLGMEFYQAPMGKPLTAITDAQVALFNDAMQNAAKPVFLHCGSGNRAAALWAVWLVEHQGVKPDEALRLAELSGMRSMRVLAEARLGMPR